MQLTKKFIILYTTSKMTTLTPEQIQDLREEFIDFKINEMTCEDMYAYIKDVYLYELNKCTIDEIKDEIDGYDEHLYELLIPYVQDREGAYEELQEYIHDRHANDWIDS